MNTRHGFAAAVMTATAFAVPALPAAADLGYCAPQPKPTISIGDDSAYEDEAAKVKVSLSGTFCSNVTVDFATVVGSATAPQDYVHTTGKLVFQPNQTMKFVTVVLNMDGVAEPNEHLWVKLSNPVNGVIGDAWGRVTIFDGPGPEG